MDFLEIASRRFQQLQTNLTDLHDPTGVYWHRACNACLATLIAAAGLSSFPAVAQPLLVIASLCFVLTTSHHDQPGRPTTLLGSFAVVFFSTGLLILTQPLPILQAVVLIGLGFGVHYLTQFGPAFAGGMFVWILSLLASVESPVLSQLPRTLINLALGCLITYLCYFWILPYRPSAILSAISQRIRLRLATRLKQTTEYWNSQSKHQHSPEQHPDLDQRIVSLMNAQETVLKQAIRRKSFSKGSGSHYHQMAFAHQELFEAILILEHSLQRLDSTAVSPQLRLSLMQLSQQVSDTLEQANLNHSFDFSLLEHLGPSSDLSGSPETQIQQQNLRQAIQALLLKANTVIDLVLTLHGKAHVH